MRYKFAFIAIINILLSNDVLLGQAPNKKNSVVLDLDKPTSSATPLGLEYKNDTILTHRESHHLLFINSADLVNSTFESSANFSFSQFETIANFSSCQFQATADFSDSRFQRDANFQNAKFQDTVNFSHSIFQSSANFSGLRLSDATKFYFYSSILPDIINFSGNIEIHHAVDFSAAYFHLDDFSTKGKKNFHYINLHNSDIAQIKIDYTHFRLCFYSDKLEDASLKLDAGFYLDNRRKRDQSVDTLKYNGRNYLYDHTLYFSSDTLYLALLEDKTVRHYLQTIFPSINIKDETEAIINEHESVIKVFLRNFIAKQRFPDALPEDEIDAIYEKVLRNFEASGQKQSYETLDIEYQDFKNGWFILPHIWYCYGYHKEWVFYWTIGFMIFFTVTTSFFIGKLNVRVNERSQKGVYYIKSIPTNLQATTWYKRFWYSLMYTSTIFFLLTLKIENLNFKNKWGVAYVMLVYSIGLLCLGYMANFVLQK